MAIVIEEEKKNGLELMRVAWFVAFIAIVGIAVYYIFFAAPELVVVPPPQGFSAAVPTGLNIQPQDVLGSPAFQALKVPQFPLPSASGPVSVGRQNPFVAP